MLSQMTRLKLRILDGDGVGDNADAFPNDATETTDSDGDGVGNNSDPSHGIGPLIRFFDFQPGRKCWMDRSECCYSFNFVMKCLYRQLILRFSNLVCV